jgi:hypothetical protein
MFDDLFCDPSGMISEKPKTYGQGLTDNPLFYTAQFFLLHHELGNVEYIKSKIIDIELQLHERMVTTGLYRRHPRWLQEQYNIPYNQISRDETFGLMIFDFILKRYGSPFNGSIGAEVTQRMIDNDWMYDDLNPNGNFFKAFKMRPIETVRKFIAYQKRKKEIPDDNNMVDATTEADIVALNFLRLPNDRLMHKVCCGIKPTIFEQVFYFVAQLYTTRNELDYRKAGGLNFATVRMKLLKHYRLPTSVKFAHYLFDRICKRKFGVDYDTKFMKRYFHMVGEYPFAKHPHYQMAVQLEHNKRITRLYGN